MTTRIKFTVTTQIWYGPQNVIIGQVMDVPEDSVANALIGQGLAVLDGVDAPTAEPLIDNGANKEDVIDG
jgi:hypothetical protein